MTDESGQRSLATRILIAVGAMLGASAVFVGAVMFLLSILVGRVVEPGSSSPDPDKALEATTAGANAPPPPARRSKSSTPSKPATGDRS